MEKRYLFTPGPTPVPPEVLAAGAEPMVHHRGSDFQKIYTSALERLQQVFRTQSDVLLFSSSGTGAMESAVANLTRPGEPVSCDVRIVELQRDAIRADGVLVLDDGTLLARVTGWSSILFHLDELMEPLHHAPHLNDAAEPQPGGWYVIRERWPTGPARDLTSRRYLDRPERARYAAMNLLEQRRWLLDTVAAKDAVRSWLREEHAVPSFPVELVLVPDGDRRYRVRSELIPAGHDPRVTIARLGWVTVAVLGDGHLLVFDRSRILKASNSSRMDACSAPDQANEWRTLAP